MWAAYSESIRPIDELLEASEIPPQVRCWKTCEKKI
uniref:Uncharacterized protein n=1 Tax=Brassica campestris TaxID=3711 RepID=A0A3P6B6P4_BRACM|nr:unnamed protein product [Brassica rapa]